MNVAIYGAGAMGTVLGAYISKAGYAIDLINRNKEHITHLQQNGAKIIGKINFTQSVTALLPEDMNKTYDIIFLMTKQKYNAEIIQFLEPYLSNEGILCTMQNGLPEVVISNIIGKDRTAGCTMSWGATFHGKGVSELTSQATRNTLTFSIGKYGNNDPDTFNYIVTLLDTMGEVTIEENFIGARWAKLLINAAFSGLSVVTGAAFGAIAKDRKTRILALEVMKECMDIAKAAHITIAPIQGKNVVGLMDYHNWFKMKCSLFILPIAMRKHKNIKSSMLRDIACGKKSEIDTINGVVAEWGKTYGIPTPINDTIISIVHQIEHKKLHPSWENLRFFHGEKESNYQ